MNKLFHRQSKIITNEKAEGDQIIVQEITLQKTIEHPLIQIIGIIAALLIYVYNIYAYYFDILDRSEGSILKWSDLWREAVMVLTLIILTILQIYAIYTKAKQRIRKETHYKYGMLFIILTNFVFVLDLLIFQGIILRNVQRTKKVNVYYDILEIFCMTSNSLISIFIDARLLDWLSSDPFRFQEITNGARSFRSAFLQSKVISGIIGSSFVCLGMGGVLLIDCIMYITLWKILLIFSIATIIGFIGTVIYKKSIIRISL